MMTPPQTASTPSGVDIEPFVDPLPVNPVCPLGADTTITASPQDIDLHSQVKGVQVWSYVVAGEGAAPVHPVLEAEENVSTAITWVNGLDDAEALPFRVVQVVDAEPTDPASLQQNLLGVADSDHVIEAAPERELVRRTVVHLHGGHSDPDNDGWPEHTRAPGEPQYDHYANTADNTSADLDPGEEIPKAGAHLWFHDHAMGITGLHVYSGLAGTYLLRGQVERDLHDSHELPITPDQGEIALLIADCNVDDSSGPFTLLHKTTMETGEFFGPLTTVNGRIGRCSRCRPALSGSASSTRPTPAPTACTCSTSTTRTSRP